MLPPMMKLALRGRASARVLEARSGGTRPRKAPRHQERQSFSRIDAYVIRIGVAMVT
jgi:hypothetical protein